MKTLLALVVGLAFAFGSITAVYADVEPPSKKKKAKKAPKPKKGKKVKKGGDEG
jgi:hypothetical protein